MKLYSAPPSYYSMIARLALNESGVPFDTRYMDIHIAKEQLSPWYMAVNPSMTVPTLIDGNRTFTDSRDILNFAAQHAAKVWANADPNFSGEIERIVAAHYAMPIEKLTFGKMMAKHRFLRKLFPRMLDQIVKKLETEKQKTTNPQATQNKIAVDEERLAYFTEGDPLKKLNDRREEVIAYIKQLPQQPQDFLFNDKTSSADIVTAILFARLKMIDEDNLIQVAPKLSNWFERMQYRTNFIKSDIWLRFKPWRILLKY